MLRPRTQGRRHALLLLALALGGPATACRAVLGIEELAVDAGAQSAAGAAGKSELTGPPAARFQSCEPLAPACGKDGQTNCCATTWIAGGSYRRLNDPNFPATLSDFGLDSFEVSVARMRTFVESGYGTAVHPPAAGAGAPPADSVSGWNSDWQTELPSSTAAFRAELACTQTYPVWTDAPSDHDVLPINCVNWFVAFAFCVWDGGRLPTFAEWNYAAAGGDEQRIYPWGSTPPDGTLAAYNCLGDGKPTCALSDLLPVGSLPLGQARFGQFDLAGNLSEWVLDSASPLANPCTDCAAVTSSPTRVVLGGSFVGGSGALKASERSDATPGAAPSNVGFRCARYP